MKRFVWLILASFCTLLAQVQPVVQPAAKHEACGCCEVKGSCGMPDCAPVPTTSSTANQLATVRPGQVEVRRAREARMQTRPQAPFYLTFVPSPATAPALRVAVATAPAAQVPLYKAQCSFLI